MVPSDRQLKVVKRNLCKIRLMTKIGEMGNFLTQFNFLELLSKCFDYIFLKLYLMAGIKKSVTVTVLDI